LRILLQIAELSHVKLIKLNIILFHNGVFHNGYNFDLRGYYLDVTYKPGAPQNGRASL
jgi:hypothetical protein